MGLHARILIGTLAIVTVVLLLYGGVVFLYTRGVSEARAMQDAARLTDNLNAAFTGRIEQMHRIIASIYASSDRARVLEAKRFASLAEEYRARALVEDFLEQLYYLIPDFQSVSIYLTSGLSWSFALVGRSRLDYDPRGEPWFRQAIEGSGGIIIIPPHEPFQLTQAPTAVSFAQELRTLAQQRLGVILLDLSTAFLDSIVAEAALRPEASVAIVDSTGALAYSNAPPALADLIRTAVAGSPHRAGSVVLRDDGAEHLAIYDTSPVTGWRIVTSLPRRVVSRDTTRLLAFSCIILALGLILAGVAGGAFSRAVVRPLVALHGAFARLRTGDFTVRLGATTGGEIGDLLRGFDETVATMAALIRERYEERIARQEAEFRFLQAQINPHFLFNSLQVISTLASRCSAPEIASVAQCLARILRYSLEDSRHMVTIGREIENARCYLDVQRTRFGARLAYRLAIPDDVAGCAIVKLVLQPILENAIRHGLEGTERGGTIEVRAELRDGGVALEVTDDGVGMSPERLREVIGSLEADGTDVGRDRGRSIGLRNIATRLKLAFGKEARIVIGSREGHGTSVRLLLPARRVPEGQM
jgi:two-component system sensor histidine kinase YesM